jgi:uncharacterized protein (DUF488 family)
LTHELARSSHTEHTRDQEISVPDVVLTAGYQGHTIDDFVRRLEGARVQVLIDIRKRPLSRKPGFSRKSLAMHVEAQHIEYMHLGELGMPESLLERRGADNTAILEAYTAMLSDKDEVITGLLQAVGHRLACILCFEADERQCHRSRLADYLHSKKGVVVRPLPPLVGSKGQ